MKRLFLVVAIFVTIGGSLEAYSIFNTRGLGEYSAPVEFLKISPRYQTSLGFDFLGEYVYATDGEVARDAFMMKPQRLRFFFPLPGKFGLDLQVDERYNLDYEVESDSVRSLDYTLIRRIESRGGIEGLRVSLDKSFYDVVYLGAGYERYFGGAWERWESEIVELSETTVDSLLYHFSGNGIWGMAGLKVGPVELRGYYGYPFNLDVRTEIETTRDTSDVDSVTYVPPSEMGGILSYSFQNLQLSAAYLQQAGGDQVGLSFLPARQVELNALWDLNALDLTGRAGWKSWYVGTSDGSPISDVYLGLGTRIPVMSYGDGIIELSGGLRKGGTISEYHVELKAGLEFKELWKKRERMWGG